MVNPSGSYISVSVSSQGSETVRRIKAGRKFRIKKHRGGPSYFEDRNYFIMMNDSVVDQVNFSRQDNGNLHTLSEFNRQFKGMAKVSCTADGVVDI